MKVSVMDCKLYRQNQCTNCVQTHKNCNQHGYYDFKKEVFHIIEEKGLKIESQNSGGLTNRSGYFSRRVSTRNSSISVFDPILYICFIILFIYER